MHRLFHQGNRCFIIAEVSANHGQNFNRGVSLIKKAKECGVDAVKFQTYTPDTLTLNIDNRYFRIRHPKWGNQTLYQLYERAYTPWSWLKKFKKIADELGIIFFSTAFDKSAVDFLEEIRVPLHKIASFELGDLALIEYVAKTKKPLILSTGMARLAEIKEAVATARKAGARDIILLKCTSSYPAKPEEMRLKVIPYMKKTFGCPIGLSDHTLGITASIAAVCLGAQVIEKHFILSRRIQTPDSFFSIEPHEMRNLVDGIRSAEKALGEVCYGLSSEERKSLVFKRSLFVVRDVKAGDILTRENIRAIRPGYGLPPRYLIKILGRKAKKAIKKGMPLKWNLIQGKT